MITKKVGFMQMIHFSDTEMFIDYEEGTGDKQWAEDFTYIATLVAYDLKTVLSLKL